MDVAWYSRHLMCGHSDALFVDTAENKNFLLKCPAKYYKYSHFIFFHQLPCPVLFVEKYTK